VLRAERDGVVKQIHAQPGDSLAVDQTILEFE
jgi:propionyl-CoA carboxylase alpha chain